jgi:hypothetical protein
MATKKTSPTWSDVKSSLAGLDRTDLLALVQDLYTASKDNQAFLHARLHLGDDVLKPYKTAITRWLWPDVFKNQDTSVAKAKKAITDYKKAGGQPIGLAELKVFYCEEASGFACEVGLQDEGFFNAMVRMFEQALRAIGTLPDAQRPAYWLRLDAVRQRCHDIGYGVSDEMHDFWAAHVDDV